MRADLLRQLGPPNLLDTPVALGLGGGEPQRTTGLFSVTGDLPFLHAADFHTSLLGSVVRCIGQVG